MNRFVKNIIVFGLFAGMPVYIPFCIYVLGVRPNFSGDLDKLGMIRFPSNYVLQDLNFTKPLINCVYDEVPTDSCVLIIGDSFSQNENGTVTTYADYFSEMIDLSVYNLKSDWGTNPINRFLYLVQQQKLPRYIILEIVERNFLDYILDADFSILRSPDRFASLRDASPFPNVGSNTLFEESQEFLRKRVLEPKKSPVRHYKLNKKCFSCVGSENDLYFYYEDLKYCNMSFESSKVKEILDNLYMVAKASNVEIMLVLAADKYSVYSPFIVGSAPPANMVVDILTNTVDCGRIVCTRPYLYSLVENDVLDVYWANNSHWSPVGSKFIGGVVAESFNKMIYE